jgi:cysteine sulfinate desulfinase/cysteine desulfurase-like protein
MGLPRDQAGSGIRFSLGVTTTEADIDHALAVVPGAVGQLRD